MYFNDCKTLDELKRQYRDLARQHHPDHGGNTADMQAVNAAYSEAVKHFSRYGAMPKSERKAAADKRRATAEVERAIEAVQNLPGLTVELVGLWVWVSGNTAIHRAELKAAGYQWASKKRMWYYAGCPAADRGSRWTQLKKSMVARRYGNRPI
jgi:hypothetical protein